MSSVVVTEKPNGKLCVCIDPQHLNRPLALTSHLIYIPLVTRHPEDNFAIVYNRRSCKLCHRPNYVEKGYLPGYHESLPDQLSKERYGGKSDLIECTDPYEILKKNWKDNVELWPSVKHIDIRMYLLISRSSNTEEELKNYKSLKCFKNFGYVFTKLIT